MSEFPTPQRFPHPTNGEIEVCVRTPEVLITREWVWQAAGGGGEGASFYLSEGCSWSMQIHSLWSGEALDVFRCWEIEVFWAPTEATKNMVMEIRITEEGHVELLNRRSSRMYVKQSRPGSYFSILPHPRDIQCVNSLHACVTPRGVGIRSGQIEVKDLSVVFHGYRGIMTRKDLRIYK